MLLFVKPRVLKDELNARFREEHPLLPPSLTLSKIRSVKRQALLGCYRAVGRVHLLWSLSAYVISSPALTREKREGRRLVPMA